MYRSKFHNQKVEVDGITFDSKKECRRYKELKLMERAGVIRGLQLQVPYILFDKSKYGRVVKYVADFVYFDVEKSKTIVEDVKGFKTDVYKLKKRILAEKYDIEILET